MTKEEKDVTDDSSSSSESEEGKVETSEEEENDKSKNFAELRKQKEETDKENVELRKRLQDKDERTLEEKPEEESKEDVTKVLFDRDLKEATRVWNKKTEVPSDVWARIRKKVSLTGEETQSEILEKIDEAYQNIPSVREKRDKALVDQGKNEAMKNFQDSEMDIGGGGDVNLGEGSQTKINPKEKIWLDKMGVKPEDQKKIDKNANPAIETIHEEKEIGIRKDS